MWKRHSGNAVSIQPLESRMADHQMHDDKLDTDGGLIAGRFIIFLLDLGEVMMSALRFAFRR